jgi:hypothetical protein
MPPSLWQLGHLGLLLVFPVPHFEQLDDLVKLCVGQFVEERVGFLPRGHAHNCIAHRCALGKAPASMLMSHSGRINAANGLLEGQYLGLRNRRSQVRILSGAFEESRLSSGFRRFLGLSKSEQRLVGASPGAGWASRDLVQSLGMGRRSTWDVIASIRPPGSYARATSWASAGQQPRVCGLSETGTLGSRLKPLSDDLESDLLAAIELSCARVRSIVESSGIPEHEVMKLGREDGDLVECTVSEVNWSVLSEELSQVDELTGSLSGAVDRLEEGSLVEVLVRDPFGEARAHALWSYALVPILKRYGAERPDWRWDAALARKLTAEWGAEQASQAEGYFRTISPLRYFDGPDEAVSIDDDLAIRPFTDQDRDDLWRDYRHMRGDSLGALALNNWSHVIDYRWSRPAGSPLGHDIGIDAVEDLVRTLRLHHPGMVQSTMIWTRRDPPTEAFTSPFHQVFLFGSPTDHEGEARRDIDHEFFNPERVSRTKIDVHDGQAIGELLRLMRSARNDRRLALALRRFDSAYSRYEFEDSLIDLWIAFEALLLPDGQSELSYRAAIRIAVLAGSEPAERRAAFKQARLSYKCRSQVVHGEATAGSLEDIVAETRELARSVLRAWIRDPPQAGIEEIDRLLFER